MARTSGDAGPLDLAGSDGSHSRAVGRRFCALSPTLLPWVLGPLAIVTYLTLFLGTLWRIGDEGSIVYGAQRVVEGAVPYRDFFEVMGPGAFYWLALWFKVLGTSWITSRAVILTTALGSASAIYYATSRYDHRPFALFPAAVYTLLTVPLWPGANHHLDSNLWVLLSFAVSIASPHFSRKRSVLVGVLAGIGATIMPQKGVLVVVALIIGTLLDAPRHQGRRRAFAQILWTIVPFGGVGLATLLFFWSRNALPDFIYANVTWPAQQYHSVNVVPYAFGLSQALLPMFAALLRAVLPAQLAGLMTVVAAIPFVLVAGSPLIAGAQVLRFVNAGRTSLASEQALPWSYWCTAFALFASECHRPDMMHLSYGSPLLLVAIAGGFGRSRLRLAVVVRLGLILSVALVAALLAVVATRVGVSADTRRGRMHMVKQDEALGFLQKDIPAGAQIFIYPYYPMYYFLADLRNPTRYSILMYHINTRDQFDEVIESLETQQVEYVLWDTLLTGQNLQQWFPAYRDPAVDEQRLEHYFKDHYSELGIKSGFRILQRHQ